MIVNEIEATDLGGRMQEAQPPLLLDVRSEAELRQGVLPGAAHMPLHLLPMKFQDLDSERDIVLYCHSGARSYQACAFLAQQGLRNTINLRGGILAWARAGLTIVPPASLGAA